MRIDYVDKLARYRYNCLRLGGEQMADCLYLVSEDLDILLGRWFEERFNRALSVFPYEEIRKKLREILTFDAHDTLFVSADRMRKGMRALLTEDVRPVISVDPVYHPTALMIHVTRCVDTDLRSLPNLYSRFGYSALETQVEDLARRLEAQADHPVDVTVVDDVVFTGGLILQIVTRLRAHHIHVRRVVAGIAVVSESHDPFALLNAENIELDAVETYGRDRPVLDEICERDFFIMSPMCGRSFANEKTNRGAPYIAPFGRAVDWASFGDAEHRVSQKLIRLNIDVLTLLAQEIGRPIRFDDLEREPNGVRHPEVYGEAVFLHLIAHLKKH